MMVKEKGRAFASMKSAVSSKAPGARTNVMAKAMSASATVISTWVTMRWAKSPERVCTLGLTATHTMESGSTGLSTATASGKASLETATSVSGSKIKLMAMDSMSGAMATAMKVNGSSA